MENIAVYLDYNLDVEKQSVWKIAHPSAEAARFPFVVNEAGVFYARHGFYTQRYAKDDYQILYTVSGAAQLEYQGKSWRLGEGSACILDCNRYHDYRTAQDADHWSYYWIHVGGGCLHPYMSAIYRAGFQPLLTGMDSELIASFREALDQIDHTTDAAYIRLNHAVSAILTKLTLFAHGAQPSAQAIAAQQAASDIQSRFADPFHINDLAARMNLSKFYLIKLFKAHMGMTPYHYLILCRISEAKKLLRATDHKVSDIARAVGFDDASNFSRTFTKIVGMAPARYRERG